MTPRWQTPLQPENWRRWWFAYLAHMATGAVAAAGMLIAPVELPELHGLASLPFALLTIMVWVRQTVEFLRRNDTPGRDLQHHMMGYVGGLAVGWAYLASHLTEVIP